LQQKQLSALNFTFALNFRAEMIGGDMKKTTFSKSSIPNLDVPQWLSKASQESIKEDPFPLQKILKDSLFYPSSGFDGDPVKHLAGKIYSFIYVDYGYEETELENALQERGFNGYEVLGSRSVLPYELTPQGWQQALPKKSDGNPLIHARHIKKGFCKWIVFERKKEFQSDHGPHRFSLLYLCSEGVCTYQCLYISNRAYPKMVAIIQPGTGFGFNWTNFEDPDMIFGRNVLGNPFGVPDYILFGGIGPRKFYELSCWPAYSELLGFVKKGYSGSIGLWKRQP
jgi:hypothetical protein